MIARARHRLHLPDSRRLEIRLCLASESPRRARILSDAGLVFDVEPARVDEDAVDAPDPAAKAVRLAELKAGEVAERSTGAAVIAADTLVVLGGDVLGKPGSPREAVAMLRRLRGRTHAVVTGVAVAGPGGRASGAETTTVRFRAYSDDEIEEYVAGGSPLDKAGAYGIQDEDFSPAESLTGCYLNVVGLPLCLAGRLLTETDALAEMSDSLPLVCPRHDFLGHDYRGHDYRGAAP